jgi:hypothetical protein
MIRTRNSSKWMATGIGTCWITCVIFIWIEVHVSVLQFFSRGKMRTALRPIRSAMQLTDVYLLSEAISVRSGSHILCSCYLTSPRENDITRNTNLNLSPTLSSPSSFSSSNYRHQSSLLYSKYYKMRYNKKLVKLSSSDSRHQFASHLFNLRMSFLLGSLFMFYKVVLFFSKNLEF